MTDRPQPSAEGQLSRTPFAHVLLYMRERRLTGTISVQAPETTPEIGGESLLAFEGGALTQVRLPHVVDPLGFVLREQGAITDDALNESLARLARGEGLQGQILVALGACDEVAIERALRAQVRRKALHLFAVTDAPYAFYADVDLLEGWGGSRVREDVLSLLWRGVRVYSDARAIDGVLAKVGTQSVRLRSGADLRVFEFDRSAQPVIDVLRCDAAPLEALLTAGADPHLARALVYVLLISKEAEIVPAGTRTTRAATGSNPAVANSSPSPQRSIPPRGSNPAVRDIPTPSGLPPDVTPELRAQYDEARDRLAAMEDETYFQMLGVATTASVDAVRVAFLQQAGRWHPDRAPTDSPSVRDLYQRIFAYVTEAQDTLGSEENAGRYLRAVQEGGGTPNSQRKIATLIEAATDTQKAEVCLRRREFDEAERLARKSLAVTGDDPNSLYTLAAVLIERRVDAPPNDEAVKLLQQAISVAPKHDRALMMLGAALRRRGDHNGALAQFRAAMAANPKNTDAAREIRLAEMRSRDGTSSGVRLEPGASDTKKKLNESFIGRFLKK